MAARKGSRPARRTTSNRNDSSITFGAAVAGALVGAGALAFGWWLTNARGGIFGTPLPEGHEAPDLALDADPNAPVPDHFRPEGDAPVPRSDRNLFAPLFAKRDRQIGDDLVNPPAA